ncbi:MAG TPA: hypothetical protein DHV59_05305 [Oxalobacteraceae bacterium]|nr:hypothetical protein [Oxalobacteraceae bacterium]
MRLSRPSRFFAVLLAVVSVLFSQLAMAAYACPGMLTDQAMAMAMAAEIEHVMPDCEQMDSAQPALCHAHMQAGDQTLDKPPSPNVPPTVAVLLMPAMSDLHLAHPPVVFYADTAGLRRASEPPLSIRNCCFRI